MATEDIFGTTSMLQPIADSLGISLQMLTAIMVIISIWSLIWKGLALWKASKKDQKIWFVVLLAVNTVGILEILYIYVFSKMNFKKEKKQELSIKKK